MKNQLRAAVIMAFAVVSSVGFAQAEWTTTKTLNINSITDGRFTHDIQIRITPGNGIIIASWQAFPLEFNSEDDLFIARSFNNGLTWTSPQKLDGFSPTYNKRTEILYLGASQWFVYVAQQNTYQQAFSNDNGLTWSQPQTLANTNVIIAGNNTDTLIKAEQYFSTDIKSKMYYSWDNGVTWYSATVLPVEKINQILHLGGTSWLALAATGEIYRSDTNGNAWNALPDTPVPLQYFATDKQGNLLAVSSVSTKTSISQYKVETFAWMSHDNGATWSGNKLIHSKTIKNTDAIALFTGDAKAIWIENDHWMIYFTNTQESRNIPASSNFLRTVNSFVAESIDDGMTWRPAEQLLSLADFTGNERVDNVIAASGGNVINAWPSSSDRREEWRADYDILYKTLALPAPPSAARDWQLFD